MNCQEALISALSRLTDANQLREAGRHDEALAAYQAATMLADSEGVLREMAVLAAGTGRLDLALRLYRRLLRRMPADATLICYAIASLYRRLDRPDRARWWFERVLAAPDATPACRGGSHFHLGGICLMERDAQAAAANFKQALQLIPQHTKAQECLHAL